MELKAAPRTDEQLMSQVRAADTEAFEQLYDRHAARALRIANAICRDEGRAEDAVREGFLGVWLARAEYRPALGSVQAWSMAIVRQRALDSPPAGADEQPALPGALALIPETQARPIALAHLDGLTQDEIAAQLNLPVEAVRGRMRRGLEALRP